MKKYIFLSILAIAMFAMVIGCGQGPGAFGLGVVGGTAGPDSDGYGTITTTPEEGEGGGGGGGGGGNASLVGEWVLTGLEIDGMDVPVYFIQQIILNADGTGNIYYNDGFEESTDDFTWSVSGSTFTVVYSDGVVSGSYTVTDTTLIFTYSEEGSNIVETYTKL